jgi:hypothetical protein
VGSPLLDMEVGDEVKVQGEAKKEAPKEEKAPPVEEKSKRRCMTYY